MANVQEQDLSTYKAALAAAVLRTTTDADFTGEGALPDLKSVSARRIVEGNVNDQLEELLARANRRSDFLPYSTSTGAEISPEVENISQLSQVMLAILLQEEKTRHPNVIVQGPMHELQPVQLHYTSHDKASGKVYDNMQLLTAQYSPTRGDLIVGITCVQQEVDILQAKPAGAAHTVLAASIHITNSLRISGDGESKGIGFTVGGTSQEDRIQTSAALSTALQAARKLAAS